MSKAAKKKPAKRAAAAQRAMRKKAADSAKRAELVERRLGSQTLSTEDAMLLADILGQHVENESERLEEQQDEISQADLRSLQRDLDRATELHKWLTQPLCPACEDWSCRCVVCDGEGWTRDEETGDKEKCLVCSGEYHGKR